MTLRSYYVIEWKWASEPAHVFWHRMGHRYTTFEEAEAMCKESYHGEQVSRVIRITEEVVSQ